jgi:hypothetical protein
MKIPVLSSGVAAVVAVIAIVWCYDGHCRVGLIVPALPSSAGLPFPMPHIYLVCRYSLCKLTLIDHFHLPCLIYVPLSTGYGPWPDAIDNFSRQSYHSPTLRFFISYICSTSILARRFPSARLLQEARNPIAQRRPTNSQLTSSHPLHPLLSFIQVSNSASLQPVFFWP